MKDYLTILRPINCSMASIAVIIGGYISGADIYHAIIASISAFLITAAGNVINDIFDINIDRINKPYKPLVKGTIGIKFAWYYSSMLFISGILLSFVLKIYNVAMAIINSLLLIIYSYKIKRIGGFYKNITISYLVSSTFIYGGFLGENVESVLILSLLAFLANNSREIIKDIEDIKGDDSMTLPKIYGIEISMKISNVFLIMAIALSPLPIVLNILSMNYLLGLIPAIISFLMSMILKNISMKKNLIKLGMLLGLISFILGTV